MKSLEIRRRKDLKIKMSHVFSREIQNLPMEMQNILLDDLVTAFENRFKALQKRYTKSEMQFLTANVLRYEVLQNP